MLRIATDSGQRETFEALTHSVPALDTLSVPFVQALQYGALLLR